MTNYEERECHHCLGDGFRHDFEFNTCAEYAPSGKCALGISACAYHACYWCHGIGTLLVVSPASSLQEEERTQ